LHGGRLPADDKKNGINQRAIIEFVCDKERTGLEGEEKDNGEHDDKDEDKEGEKRRMVARNGESGKCEDSDKSLRFCGYEFEEPTTDTKVQTLRLEWRTKHACEDAPAEPGSHWGFFTWFIIMCVMPPP
jgi:hypothetical protein